MTLIVGTLIVGTEFLIIAQLNVLWAVFEGFLLRH